MTKPPHEFEIANNKYRCDLMPGRTQFHVFRRMGKIVGRLVQLAMSDSAAMQAENIVEIASVISDLDDDEANYILDNCLATVKRKVGPNDRDWAPVKADNTPGTMFLDIEMDDEMKIVGHVVQHNFWPLIKKNLDAKILEKLQAQLNSSASKTAPIST